MKIEVQPAIWQRAPEFKRDAASLLVAASALDSAAAKGDLARTRAAAAALGPTCKTCHDTFRKRD
ncbi:MAG TPA: cytochrome c [Allosphingosinicella sp.]|nr:cytochrome c [Allosphingosinicella sp.]